MAAIVLETKVFAKYMPYPEFMEMRSLCRSAWRSDGQHAIDLAAWLDVYFCQHKAPINDKIMNWADALPSNI